MASRYGALTDPTYSQHSLKRYHTSRRVASRVLQHFRLFTGIVDLNSNARIRSTVAGLNLRPDFHVSGKTGNLIFTDVSNLVIDRFADNYL